MLDGRRTRIYVSKSDEPELQPIENNDPDTKRKKPNNRDWKFIGVSFCRPTVELTPRGDYNTSELDFLRPIIVRFFLCS